MLLILPYFAFLVAPYDVAQRASTIITMVPTGKHVEDVYLGDNSVLAALETLDQKQRSSTLCLDQSTIEQSVSKSVALKLRKTGADLLDDPVSGGISLCPLRGCSRIKSIKEVGSLGDVSDRIRGLKHDTERATCARAFEGRHGVEVGGDERV